MSPAAVNPAAPELTTDESRALFERATKVTPGRVVELMRQCPNLHGDLSAGSGFNALTRDPEFGYRFIEEFQDRLYFGTDMANVPQKLPIVDYFKKLEDDQLICAAALEKVSWLNASRLLKLE